MAGRNLIFGTDDYLNYRCFARVSVESIHIKFDWKYDKRGFAIVTVGGELFKEVPTFVIYDFRPRVVMLCKLYNKRKKIPWDRRMKMLFQLQREFQKEARIFSVMRWDGGKHLEFHELDDNATHWRTNTLITFRIEGWRERFGEFNPVWSWNNRTPQMTSYKIDVFITGHTRKVEVIRDEGDWLTKKQIVITYGENIHDSSNPHDWRNWSFNR